MKICKVEGCNNPSYEKGYCARHYSQIYRHGRILKRTIYDPNEIILCDTFAEIVLYNKQCSPIAKTRIDIEDIEKIKKYKWSLDGFGYVQAYIPQTIRLHRLLLNAPKGMDVDHINHDTLDNRKSNLRICNRSQNTINGKKRITNKSGVPGVNWNKQHKKWEARVWQNYKTIRLGFFIDFNEAVKARREAEQKYYGKFAYKD